mmetsp:Transcript_4070/g.9295  ORF Transcript_4070/g.9295 Transcript_4070/m.9295 type:complete len:93 (+) Transcript_4070:187-465(+)
MVLTVIFLKYYLIAWLYAASSDDGMTWWWGGWMMGWLDDPPLLDENIQHTRNKVSSLAYYHAPPNRLQSMKDDVICYFMCREGFSPPGAGKT